MLALTTLGLALGTLFVLTRVAGNMATVLNYPIFILSGLTVPITILPLWTRPFSYLLAPTWGSRVLNLAAGIGTDALWPSFLWLAGLALAYYGIAQIAYRQIERLARKTGGLNLY
jgi:ABC-2 type transport system permease protein